MTQEQWGSLQQDLLNTVGQNNYKAWIEPLRLTELSDGVATFTGDGNKMFFSRNNMEGKNVNDQIDRKIYEADWSEEGTWTNITELPFNSDDYSSCHPTLSADGKRLYFAMHNL